MLLTNQAAAVVAEASGPSDLLRRLLESGQLSEPLRAIGVDPVSLGDGLDFHLDEVPGCKQVVDNATQEAHALGDDRVGAVHLLMGLLYNDLPSVARPLAKKGLSLYDLRTYAMGAMRAASVPAPVRAEPLPLFRVLRPSPAFLVPLAAFVVGGVPLYGGPPGWAITPLTILFVLGGWITSLCLHEFGHAVAAYLGGDASVAAAGYLSLNPLRYTHRLLSIVLPVVFVLVGGIGLPGGAVYVDRGALRSRKWDALVAAAGPLMTLMCAAAIAAVFTFAPIAWFPRTSDAFWAALAWLGVIEVSALLLNLLPIPPFDGWGIVSAGLSWETRARAAALGMLGIFVVFFILWQGPVANVFWGLVYTLTDLGQIPGQLADLGRAQMSLIRTF